MASTLYGGTTGNVPTFDFTGVQTFGPGMSPMSVQGSQAGVPGPQGAVGMVESGDGATGVSAAAAFGGSKAGTAAHNQPIWWAVVLFSIGFVMVGHVAHVSMKR